MQSTQPTQTGGGTVLFRGLVMAGFLGGIFYVALSGNALPDAARKQIEKVLPKSIIGDKSGNSDAADAKNKANAGGDAPLFNASSKTAANAGAAPLMSLGNAEKSRYAGGPAGASPSQNSDAPRKLTADSSASLLPTPPAGGMPLASVGGNSGPVVPVNYQAPLENLPSAAPRSSLEEAAQKLNASLNPPAANPFSEMQNRLRQLGATYYLLETWGNEQQYYRFYCKMAVGGNTNYTHCFESTDSDPIAAMTTVLKQVEAWRNGGSIR
jgi:hypothetical protein